MAPVGALLPASLALLVALAGAPVRAQDNPVTETSVKAAFLFKFPGFIQWPDGGAPPANAPIVIGVLGHEEVAAELETIATSRRIEQRTVVVRRIAGAASLAGVHVVFVGSRERGRIEAVARQAHSAGLLVVADWEGALRQGAAINFVPSEGRIRFEVAIDNAEKAGLRLSSRLLAVAQNVVGAKP